MSHEFLDYVEDILDAMEKAEILLNDVTYGELVNDCNCSGDSHF